MAMSVTYTTVAGMLVHEIRGGVETEYTPHTLGNLIECHNMDGVSTYTADYWPYGEVRTSTGTNPSPWGFVGLLGYYTDALNFLYVRARYYRPQLTRWQTVDPLWPEVVPYAYGDLSPTFFIDPMGLAVWMSCNQHWFYYTHAYIKFDVPCEGCTSCGFYPTSGGRLGSCSASSSGSSSSSSSSHGPTKNPTGCTPGSKPTNHGSPGSNGEIECPDHHQSPHQDPACTPHITVASVDFDKALCKCVQKSLQHPPNYCFPGYVCGSWVASMWACAKKSLRASRPK